MIRRGVHASVAKQIIADLALGQGIALKALNLSTATVNRRAKQEDTLSPAESERVIGIARLVGQVEVMVRDSGDPVGFDARAWISRWLQEPLPSLWGESAPSILWIRSRDRRWFPQRWRRWRAVPTLEPHGLADRHRCAGLPSR